MYPRDKSSCPIVHVSTCLLDLLFINASVHIICPFISSIIVPLSPCQRIHNPHVHLSTCPIVNISKCLLVRFLFHMSHLPRFHMSTEPSTCLVSTHPQLHKATWSHSHTSLCYLTKMIRNPIDWLKFRRGFGKSANQEE